MKKLIAIFMAIFLAACGKPVEIPPAHVGKVMTKDGYQEAILPTSKFRLPPCWAYCDKLVLLNVADQAYEESLNIFIPTDKLTIDVNIRTTLSVDPTKTKDLFTSITPEMSPQDSDILTVPSNRVYSTYASQITQAEAREYLSQFSISEIASSIEKMNSELRDRLTKRLQERTPYKVRYVGITGIKFPDIITKAQENAAERRERIEQENAQLDVSRVALERELQEAQLTRKIEEEKAKTEAIAQRMLAETVDERVLKLRKLENERLWIQKWNGQLPTTALGESIPMVRLQ
jgi:hypothetical protein